MGTIREGLNNRNNSNKNIVCLARKRCKLSIEELSDKTGIPKFAIKSIETGRRMPSIEELHELSLVLNVSYLDIVGELLEA